MVRAGASSDEDNARPSLNYEPGPAIINSGKHSFSYTQVYVVLSRTKRPPPMSFSIPVMVLIAAASSPRFNGRPLYDLHPFSPFLKTIIPSPPRAGVSRIVSILSPRGGREPGQVTRFRFFPPLRRSCTRGSKMEEEEKGGGDVFALIGEQLSFPRNRGSSGTASERSEKRNGASLR